MNILPKSALFTRLFKILALSLVLVAGGLLGAQAASAAPQSAAIQAAPAVQAQPPSAMGWGCSTTLYTNGVERNCTVTGSTIIRSYLTCSNGVTYYTPWLGAGSWYILQVCPSGYYRTASGVQYYL